MSAVASAPRFRLPLGLAAPVFVAVTIFVLVPCVNLLVQSLNPAAESAAWPDSVNFAALFNSKIGQQALERTIRVSVIVSLVCIVAGYPVALFVSRVAARWRATMLAIVIFPFLISAVVRAFGWTVILGRSGLVNVSLLWLGVTDEPLALVQNEVGARRSYSASQSRRHAAFVDSSAQAASIPATTNSRILSNGSLNVVTIFAWALAGSVWCTAADRRCWA